MNKNKKKQKMQKKATLKITHMPAIIQEEKEVHTDTLNTTIKEAAEQQQPTRHT